MQTAWRAQQPEVVMRLTWCSSSVSPQVLWPYWSRSLTWLSLWWAPWAAALWPSSSLPCFRSSPSIMKTWSGGRWSRTSASVSLASWALWQGRTSPSRRLWHGTAADTTALTCRSCERWRSDRLNVDRLNHLLTTCSFDFCSFTWERQRPFLNVRRWLMDFLCVFVFSFCSTKVSSYQVALASKNSFLLNILGDTAFYPNFKVNINRIISILLILMSCLQCFSATTESFYINLDFTCVVYLFWVVAVGKKGRE